MEDLWPNDIIAEHNLFVAPVSILKEQATILGQKTKNQIEGIIGTDSIAGQISHYFYIFAPSIPYRFQVFKMEGDVLLYPVKITIDQDIYNEVTRDNRFNESQNNTLIIENEDDLKLCLRDIFASEKMKKLINSLLATIRV